MPTKKVKVPECKSFRQMAATAICRELSGDVQGEYFVDPMDWRLYFRERSYLWNPWGDSLVIPLTDLAPGAIGSTSEVEDWQEALESKEFSLVAIINAYTILTGGNTEADGSLAEWAWSLKDDAIEWARNTKRFSLIIKECEEEARERLISFILEEFQDEIEVEFDFD